jgi:polyhydroxyalkanoate synthesis regulator protein
MSSTFGGVGVGFGPMEDQVRRNMEMFERAFAMFAPFARAGQQAPAGTPEAEGEKPRGPGEIDDLKRQMEEMQKRLERLGDTEKK